MRAQFTGLNDLINALPASPVMAGVVATQVLNLLAGVSPLSITVSNPPTQAQVQAIADRLNLLINALKAPV